MPASVESSLALAVVAVVAAVWALWAHWRARALARALDDARAVVERLAEGQVAVRAFHAPDAPPPARRLAAALNDLARRLEESGIQRLRRDEAYRRLLADLSHDLRTPLTSIIGYVEALRTGASRDPARHLDVVAARAAQLGRLVDDLLLLTRLEAGDGVVRREPTDLGEVVRRACEPFREALEERAIRLALELPPQPAPALADPTAVSRIVANLLDNALHHAGPVHEIAVRLHAAEPGGGADARSGAALLAWCLEVANDGDPIAPEELPMVFERGFRGRSSRGTGLGLAIVRMLAEAHGGQVEVESDPSARRTVFRVRLPHGYDEGQRLVEWGESRFEAGGPLGAARAR
ncbi:sensor histidine kinase [Geochorda subterranea]|uniref:histidine kinase n=1 Tax=Geochorda subterranea TaxID=3109564 RepID=A0ABZ1BLR3_9FIRM|nr:HAMP domain-containing sensor histidine kinase [Limnochorda sp. LNt]WRP13684.1 HAMP domain-containing sensor histidine kinase [Limnochorda sp. LNt]